MRGEAVAVRDVPAEHRFVAQDAGMLAQLIYKTAPSRLILVHTEVPEHLAGRGIGGSLVRAALDRAASEHLTIVPLCPFARRWLKDHPETANAARIDWAQASIQSDADPDGQGA